MLIYAIFDWKDPINETEENIYIFCSCAFLFFKELSQAWGL